MVKSLLRWGNVLLIVLTLLVYLAPQVNPLTFWPMAFLGPLFPWLVLLHLGFIVFWIVARKAYFLMSLVCLLLGWNYLTAIWAFRFPQSGEGADFRVMSYNLFLLQGIMDNDEDYAYKRQGSFKSFMASVEPLDVLATQECSQKFAVWMNRELKYPYSYTVQGTTIFSRHPFLDRGSMEFEKSVNSIVWADFKIKGQVIRVYSAHLQSIQISDEAEKLKETGDLQEKKTWVGIGGIMRKYKRASQKRVEQAAQLAAHISKSPYPVVVCGDFNETPVSYTYRRIADDLGLVDTFREKGSGSGFTYGGFLPALRLDYILSDPKLTVLNHDRFKNSYSDHFPVLCEFDLPQ
ncbi:MAG: endonuclease/exonuclease/phosphatase family protein [Saprospirales bacterium]|jgi:endonuclease/exonuclease/phosphatase family metal-dependent hydrolase|nr:endonuclease/exonuclease/phosphatase family protein [Saprospirales bacterium]